MILIDDRDGSRELLLCPVMQGHAVLGRLDFGDAMLTGHGPDGGTITVGVEVKSVSDLLTSISTGRLGGHQIPGMLRTYDRCWLLVYGQARPDSDRYLEYRKGKGWRKYRVGKRYVPWSYLEGFLLTASMVGGVHIKWVNTRDEAAAWLVILAHWLDKPWDKHHGLSVFYDGNAQAIIPGRDPGEEQVARTAASLPAIGWERAWAAARHFGSIKAMALADEKEWTKVKGIGPVIAHSVVEAIRRKK